MIEQKSMTFDHEFGYFRDQKSCLSTRSIHMNRHINRQNRQIGIRHLVKYIESQIARWIDKLMDRQLDRQLDRQTYRQIDREVDRHTHRNPDQSRQIERQIDTRKIDILITGYNIFILDRQIDNRQIDTKDRQLQKIDSYKRQIYRKQKMVTKLTRCFPEVCIWQTPQGCSQSEYAGSYLL